MINATFEQITVEGDGKRWNTKEASLPYLMINGNRTSGRLACGSALVTYGPDDRCKTMEQAYVHLKRLFNSNMTLDFSAFGRRGAGHSQPQNMKNPE